MAFCKISDGFNNPDNLLMGHRMAQASEMAPVDLLARAREAWSLQDSCGISEFRGSTRTQSTQSTKSPSSTACG